MVDETKPVKDWTYLPFIVTASSGFIVSVLDFIFLQYLRFQVVALAGIFLYTIGAYVRFKSRLELKEKAKFDSLAATGKLQINKGHQLVKDGLYQHIRHPIYLGETLRNLGIVIVLTSVFGLFFVAVATILLLFRIEIEERMLIETFGEDYREYRKNTKKIIPYVY
jgi:protein-S-isoprenylcysteine O-methyltransferase Ste14